MNIRNRVNDKILDWIKEIVVAEVMAILVTHIVITHIHSP